MSSKRLVLAMDTATAPGGVAVGNGADVFVEVTLGITRRHSELLLPAIDFALNAARVTIADVDAIICGAGPGSFTGVRIAAAMAKGLVHARHVPLYAYSSLLAAAMAAAHTDGAVCALFDARRGEAFGGCWRLRDGRPEALLEPTADDVATIVAALASHDPLYVGTGAWRNRERIRELGGRVGDERATVGCAGALVRLHAMDENPEPVDAAHWQPEYLRAPYVAAPRDIQERAQGSAVATAEDSGTHRPTRASGET